MSLTASIYRMYLLKLFMWGVLEHIISNIGYGLLKKSYRISSSFTEPMVSTCWPHYSKYEWSLALSISISLKQACKRWTSHLYMTLNSTVICLKTMAKTTLIFKGEGVFSLYREKVIYFFICFICLFIFVHVIKIKRG